MQLNNQNARVINNVTQIHEGGGVKKAPKQKRKKPKKRRCYRCGSAGHIARNCPGESIISDLA